LKRIKNIILMLVIFVSFGIAQDSTAVSVDSTRFDGHSWKKTNLTMMIPYLTGVFDGLSLGSTLVLSSFQAGSICAQTGAQNIDDFYQRLETLTVYDLYQSIKSFYDDTLNLNVMFDNAFIIGVYKASKADPKIIDKLTVIYRKEDNDEKK
jgi:hypothetical protein